LEGALAFHRGFAFAEGEPALFHFGKDSADVPWIERDSQVAEHGAVSEGL
jgi:hypothetical protein